MSALVTPTFIGALSTCLTVKKVRKLLIASICELLPQYTSSANVHLIGSKVFGTKSSNKSTATSSAGPSDFQLLEAQLAEKRAHKITDAAGTAAA
jgi:hypothetical protein